MPEDHSVVSQFRQSAPGWEKHRRIHQIMFLPVTEALVADANIASGHSVLDVATGPGEPALSILDAVGPHGQIVGVDLVPEMVEAARREAARSHLDNVRFEVAPAEKLPFETNGFHAAISRFGVMFFASPLDGVREMLRVIKPSAKMAFAVWHLPERNPFHDVVSRVIEKYVNVPPVDPDSPDAFRFATPGKLVRILKEAGAVDLSERLLKFHMQASLSPEEFWTMRREMSDKLRSRLAALSEAQIEEIKREVVEGARKYSTKGRISFPAEVLIISGRKN